MMTSNKEKLIEFVSNKWVVFVAAMWMQSFAGSGYMFGSISPAIKSYLNYNQKQVSSLGVAKDLGGSVGFVAGILSQILPLWAVFLVGAAQNFAGYGLVWLIVTSPPPTLPLWAMCIFIFVASNGETYFNTGALVSCAQNFPKSRGPVVGILKGFAGLSGAILTQIYVLIHAPDNASLILILAVGPTMVIIALMFIVSPVGGYSQLQSIDGASSSIIYSVCLILAVYLMGVMLVEDLVDLNQSVIILFTVILFIILVVPIGIPIWTIFSQEPKDPSDEALLPEAQEHDETGHDVNEISEVEDEEPSGEDLLPTSERQERTGQLQADIALAAAGSVRVNTRRGPDIGEDFTLMQALIKVDFWLIFFSLILGSGSGLTVIDNLGQMSESLGYDNSHIFVSLVSIWNFLGRVGGGYFSEIIVREYAYPRHAAMAVAQFVMAFGLFFIAMGWPWAMYVGTLLVGLCFGAHWAIIPAAVSELFGLKQFGMFYNILTLANPAGSLIFSGLIASSIYDSEAEKQAQEHHISRDEAPKCYGAICFGLTSLIMSGLCIVAAILSLILVNRTKVVYGNLYGKSKTPLWRQ